jgi:hypothetical protein
VGKYTPTLSGFTAWVFGSGMGVPSIWLEPDDPNIALAYTISCETVRKGFQCIAPAIYMLMVYNLGGAYLAQFAQDPIPLPDPPFISVDGVDYGFWSYLRKTNGLNGFTSGIVTGSSDEGTSVTLAQPKWADNLTMGQLQLTNTPWGRLYLGWAQDAGTGWGLS